MKKKIIITIAVILAVCITGITAGALIMNFQGISVSTGVALKSENGTCFLVNNNSPIRLSDFSEKGDRFNGLSDGDKILVLHGVTQESYPASTFAYFAVKLSDGTIDDVPETVITALTELGWLEGAENESSLTFSEPAVCLGNENANFSIEIPDGWSYETTTTSPLAPSTGFGISIFHDLSPESTVTVEFTESFGVCGTGLRTEEITVGEYKAHKGIYDGSPTFDYIVFEDTPGFYVIYNYADAAWWAQHKNEIWEILATIKIADGILFHDDALTIAASQAKGEYKEQYNEYSHKDGTWSFTFETTETAQVIKVDKNGNVI